LFKFIEGEVFIIYLLVLVLNKVEFTDRILARFLQIGISGATIIDTTGMGRTLMYNDNIPIFGGLNRIFQNCRPINKTIFSVINDKDMLQKAIRVIKEEVGDLDKPGEGILFTLPIDYVMGLTQNNNK